MDFPETASTTRAMGANSDTTAPLLKVANIIEESRYGGPQRRIALVAERLKAHHIETTVICARMGSERFSEELAKREVSHRTISLHRLTRNPPELLLAILLFPVETLRLARLLRRGRFDIVHCNGSWQWKGILAGWMTRTAVVWHLNDTNVPRVVHFVFRRLSNLAAGFIVAGDRVRDYYLNQSVLKTRPTFKIQAPVDCAYFIEEGAIDPEIAALPGIKVLTIANINPAKGLDILVKVAARFKNKRTQPVSFAVIGSHLHSQKKYFQNLQRLQKQLQVHNLHFLGPRSDIPACLRAADIGLCCSVAEASPMAVWETAAAGIPIVATDVGDVKNFNSLTNFGYVTPINDCEMLTDTLLILTKNPSKRKELGQNGKNFAKLHLDISVCVQQHEAAYRSMLDQL